MAPQHDKPGTARAAKSKPVTGHPLFPAVIALWFGALFGLGSLAIRVGLLESLVLASRIDTLIPAAAPPLGVSARILLALVLAAIGALLGASIARRIARPKPEVRERKRNPFATSEASLAIRTRDSHPDAPARRPISAHEELGGVSEPQRDFGSPALAGRRRNTLAIEHDETFELHELAPLPGSPAPVYAAGPDADALDLGSFAAPEEPAGTFMPPPPAAASPLDWTGNSPVAISEPAEAGRQMFQPANTVAADTPLNFSPPSDAVEGRQVFGMAQRQPDEVLDQLGITDAEFEDLPPVEIPSAEPLASKEPIVNAVPSDPGKVAIVELAEQLAQSLRRRRERVAEVQAQAVAAIPAAAPVIEVPAELGAAAVPAPLDAPIAAIPQEYMPDLGTPQPFSGFTHPNDIPAPFASPVEVATPQFSLPPVFAAAALPVQPVAEFSAMPAALRPIAFDTGSDDEDDALASLLPPRSIVMPSMVIVPDPVSPVETEAGDEEVAEESFSSLLDVAKPAAVRQDFVRIEELEPISDTIEPVVIFPGQAARPVAVEAQRDHLSSSSAEPTHFRRFDAPSSAEAGQDVAASSAPAHDADEAERALRAALANLQRMSGAA